MATVVAMAPPMPARTATPPPHLTLNTSSRGTPAAIPNKHIPHCTPGPRPVQTPDTPPTSPPRDGSGSPTSTLHPPETFKKISHDPPVYSLDARTVAEAIEHVATQPLPDPKLVFPWLHGLHAENAMQLAFFVNKRRSLRKVPKCLRGLTIVKAGGELSMAKLKGAIAPEELLLPCGTEEDNKSKLEFIEADPKDGFSVRNFQIQACKMATISDIVVYGDHSTGRREIVELAKRISEAQIAWRYKSKAAGNELPAFNTFVVSDPFSAFEQRHSDIVAIDSSGNMTNNVVDFFYWERYEMCSMSRNSEISNNVFLGPTPDPLVEHSNADKDSFDVHIETADFAHLPELGYLRDIRKVLDQPEHPPVYMEFASSGSIQPPTWSHAEVDALLEMCRWIYEIANPGELNGTDNKDQFTGHPVPRPQKVMIHCADGYTESSLLGLTYFMYAEGLPVHEAWVKLHRDRGRNFFAYVSDVSLLRAIQPRILQESPRYKGSILSLGSLSDPRWLTKLDGSLPSRILPYMYLGNLNHANNPEMLRELGITRILSVGEPVSWSREVLESWPEEDLMLVDRVQDNGVDPLTGEFERCLKFIEQGKRDNTATLVHCRVGVSRSATICIAEVMNELGLSFPRAYCFVRARRLNVIIQPHLKFTYELLKYEEQQRVRRGQPLRRELEWATVAREVAAMNKPYSRQQ